MEMLSNNSLNVIQSYTQVGAIDGLESINTFNGVIITSNTGEKNSEQSKFNIIIFNTSLRVRYFMPYDVLNIQNAIGTIKDLAVYPTKNTSRLVILSKYAFTVDELIAKLQVTKQTFIPH